MTEQFTYGDIVTDLTTGRVGTFIEFTAPCGAEDGMTFPQFAIVEFGGDLGVPDTGECEEVRV